MGATNLPEGIWRTIMDRSEGNPFYLEEVVRHLMERDLIVRDDEGWRTTEKFEEMSIPDTLHGVLLARIDRLEEDVRRTLQMAAVIGKTFLYRILETISEAEMQLDTHLSQLQRVDLVREKTRIPELEYIFKHTLTQEAAYNSLLHERRKVFHLKVGEALEELFPDRVDEFSGLMAYHFEVAETHEKAVDYLQRAGDQARQSYAHQEAIDFYKRALVILKEQEEYDRAARMLMKLGLTYHTAFDYKRSRGAYDEAFSMRQEGRLIRPASLPTAPHPFRRLGFEPLSIDPTRSPDNLSDLFIRNIFSGLVELGTEGEIIPDVALYWEISDDGRRYVFRLREDVNWSDGQQVTAEDFEYSFMRLLDPRSDSKESIWARLLFAIKNAKAFHQGEISEPDKVGVKAVDMVTLEVDLEKPASYFLHLLANFFPIPRHVVETIGESWADWEKIVTNGPFQPESFQPGESIILVRNPKYHGRFPGNLQKVQIKLMDPQLAETDLVEWGIERYKSDSIDVVGIGIEAFHLRHQYAEEYTSVSIPGMYFIGFDTGRPPFNDPRVRKAFALAIDKEKLADEVPEALLYPAFGGLVPPGVPGHSPGIGLPYDPAQACKLLAQAGYPGGKGFPPLEIVTASESNILEYLMTQWLDNLNVKVALEVLEWEKVVSEFLNRNLFYMGWIARILDPDYFLRVCVREYMPSQRNEAYDQLIEGASSTLNQGERIQLYQTADKLLIEEAVDIPIIYMQGHYLIKPWVKTSSGGIVDWIFKDVIIEPH
jgi:oligopeptide transport system substrate-binding protein